MTVKEVLERIILLIEEHGWFQGEPKKLGEVCLVYALTVITEGKAELYNATYIHLTKQLGLSTYETLINWNDAEGRTKEEVIELLCKGIQACA